MSGPHAPVDAGRRRFLAAMAGCSLGLLGTGATVLHRVNWFVTGTASDWVRTAEAPARRLRSGPPTTPGPLRLLSAGPAAVLLGWQPSYDDGGLVAQRIERDGLAHDDLAPDAVRYVDTRCEPGRTHAYRLFAIDGDGNETATSEPCAVAVPDALLVDELEEPFNGWELAGLSAQGDVVRSGNAALRGITVDGQTSAVRRLVAPAPGLNCQLHVRYDDKDTTGSLTVVRFRSSTGAGLCSAFISPSGLLGVRNDQRGVSTTSNVRLEKRRWYALSLSLSAPGGARSTTLALDGDVLDGHAELAQDLDATSVGMIQIGEVRPSRRYEFFLDRLVVWQ